MPVIVLISGYAGSGKDTFAGFLIKHLSGAQKYAFADPIKEIARKYFEWDGIKDERGRKLLIEIGAAGMEENLYIWAERVIEKIMEEQSKTAVITDWRFKHEYQRIKKAFGNKNIVTIRIERERLNIIDDITEHDLDDFLNFDFVVSNNGSLQDLEEKARITAKNIQNIHSMRTVIETNGIIRHKIWSEENKIHRENGPAWIEYYVTGNVKTKAYFFNGVLHREDGPAVKKYTPDGKMYSPEYYLNGERVSKEAVEEYRKIHSLLKKTKESKKVKL